MPVASASLPSAQRKAPATARRRMRRSQARLAGYLAATAGSCGLATTADAEVIAIDISAFSGPNGGLSGANNQYKFTDFAGPVGSGTLWAMDGYTSGSFTWWGLYPTDGLSIAVNPASGPSPSYYDQAASPKNFGLGSSVGSSETFATYDSSSSPYTYEGFLAVFQWSDGSKTKISPDFGANSFIGFRFANGSDFNYGYLEVTWDSASTTWEVLSGAYENSVNTGILTSSAAPVPEPGASTMAFGALASLCLGGSALKRWKKQRRGGPRPADHTPAGELPSTPA